MMATDARELSRNHRSCEEALQALKKAECHVAGTLFCASIGGGDRDLIKALIGVVRDRIELRKADVDAELLRIEAAESVA